MAQLLEIDRQRIWRGLMRHWSNLREALGNLDKAELKAAIDATDAWIDDNETSFNNSLPQPARNQLTQDQKTLLFCAVALMRVSGDFLRRIFGEVD